MDHRLSVAATNDDIEGLRLVALGRIERCSRCPRYEALVAGYLGDRLDGPAPARTLPPVPAECRFQACTPLVVRRSWAASPAAVSPRPASRRAAC
jgi:hypothetical protein